MQPRKSILDRTFRYTNAADTNIRKTFWRIRFQLEQEQRQREPATVQPLRSVK